MGKPRRGGAAGCVVVVNLCHRLCCNLVQIGVEKATTIVVQEFRDNGAAPIIRDTEMGELSRIFVGLTAAVIRPSLHQTYPLLKQIPPLIRSFGFVRKAVGQSMFADVTRE